MRKAIIIAILIIIGTMHAHAMNDDDTLTLSNEFVQIVVGISDIAAGRFSMDTTGGNPLRDTDIDATLIYGSPFPWASYTTIRIDGGNYIYGGESELRAGRAGKFGEMVQFPEIVDGTIKSSWQYDNILVTQNLSIARSSTTGEPDTMRIEYVVENVGTTRHDVGLRVMLDTFLGDNDGAPFRVAEEAIDVTRSFERQELPDFWQAFDSLARPQVLAQGTFRDKDATPPDLVYFADWGTLADNVWTTRLDYGEDFIRAGERHPDSAMAMFWMPETLMPGEARRYITYYGLGDVSIAPGSLSIGVTSPSEVVAHAVQPQSFPIIAYVQNTADERALQVNIELKLPEGLKLAPNQQSKYLVGNMMPDEERQVSWDVIPTGSKIGTTTYEVEVTSTNTEDNLVTRDIRILSPPVLRVSADGPAVLSVVDERILPFRIRGLVENEGGTTAYGVRASMGSEEGITIAEAERKEKYIGTLEPGESMTVPWRFISHGVSGDLEYEIQAFGPNVETTSFNNKVSVPELHARIFVKSEYNVSVGDFVVLEIMSTNIEQFHSIRFDVHYDPDILRGIRVSRGEVFIQDGQYTTWDSGKIDNTKGVINDITGVRIEEAPAHGLITRISFRVEEPGESKILLRNVEIRREDTREIMATIDNGVIVAK